MAEFSEVSRGYIRMCESFFETCEGCPISACSGNDIYVCRNRVLKNPEKYEDTIMKWAAEHPVYPTWMEWLAANVPGVDADSIYEAVQVLNRTRIPADIAPKLVVETKEG